MNEHHFKLSLYLVIQVLRGGQVEIYDKDKLFKFSMDDEDWNDRLPELKKLIESGQTNEWLEALRNGDEPPYPFCDSCDNMATHQCLIDTDREFCDRWLCEKHRHKHT